MEKYRIVTNDVKYRIQERIFFFFWLYIERVNMFSIGPIEFDNLDAAREYMNYLENYPRRKKYGRFKTIT